MRKPDWRGFWGYYGNRHTKLRPLGFELGVTRMVWTQEFAHVWKNGSVGPKSPCWASVETLWQKCLGGPILARTVRDPSTPDVPRVREAHLPLSMTT